MDWIRRKPKGSTLAVAALLAAVAVFGLAYWILLPRGMDGGKTIYVEIVTPPDHPVSMTVTTNAQYLRQALEEAELIQGEEGAYGLFVQTVNGVTADDGKGEWWCFTSNGEMLMTGVDQTPIHDGDHYEISLTAGN